jgi:hypothetical protein
MSDEEDDIEDETSDWQDLDEQRPGDPFATEEISEDLVDLQEDSSSESPSEEEFTVSENEEDSQTETEIYISEVEEAAPDLDPAAELALATESGVISGDEPPDFNDIEEQTLNAQMEESLRNPAYLQSFTEEAPPGESSGGD